MTAGVMSWSRVTAHPTAARECLSGVNGVTVLDESRKRERTLFPPGVLDTIWWSHLRGKCGVRRVAGPKSPTDETTRRTHIVFQLLTIIPTTSSHTLSHLAQNHPVHEPEPRPRVLVHRRNRFVACVTRGSDFDSRSTARHVPFRRGP